MTTASVLLAAGCAALAVVAALAVARARRAEAARRASEDTPRRMTAEGLLPDATRLESEQQIRHARILEDVGRTADVVAHDFKDLLTAITGRTELLIASLDEAHPGRPEAFEIRRLALSAARMSKPLRALSGALAATDLIDVNMVISRTADAFKEMLGSDIDVSLALDPGVMRVRAGAGHVEEIVLTLAMNARAAMPGGGRLTVSTAGHTHEENDPRLGSGRECVRIALAHTEGVIPEIDRKLVESPGTGAAGLARVLDVVKRAGGWFSVESPPGGGTMFVVDLPAAMEPAPAEGPLPARAIKASVLVVEDEPRVRELIKVFLSREGHDVVAVAGPHDGLAVLKRQPSVELMLIDIVMPDMNGYDLAVQARAVAPGLRVVFMSGFARDCTRHPTADRFLAKPFAVESLRDVVQQALSDL
jgi:two-component system, cell cycle sensor histidine kinase and response regulator CckA